MYQDGLRIGSNGEVVLEAAIYTYNQGPVLGALLELGGEPNLDRAAALVDAVARNLTRPATAASGRTAAVLRCDGTGDGGLFTGILVRYLALAAATDGFPAETRATAAALVNDTAEAFWEGRRIVARPRTAGPPGGQLVFSVVPETAGAPQLSGGRRRRTFHPTAGLDGAGGRRNRWGSPRSPAPRTNGRTN